MAYDKERITRSCPIGKHIVQGIAENAGEGADLTELTEDVETLEGKVLALETALAAVLAATEEDEGKVLKIDAEGLIELADE